MNTVLIRLPAYLQLAKLASEIPFTYRANWIFHFVSVLLQIYLLKIVWTAVYAGRGAVDGIGLDQMLTYLTLANLQWNILWPFLVEFMHDRVREGNIALDLARPIGLVEQMLSYQVGMTAGTVPFLVLAFPLAILLGRLQLPASAEAAGWYLVSLILGYMVVVLIGLLLGLLSFWTTETSGFFTVYQFTNQFFAGTFIPLWFFPPILRTIAQFLPFQGFAFVPVAIYLGQLTGPDRLLAIGTQLFWAFALYLAARFVWRRSLRRVVIQGG
ncbi:MAG TPA: ABC-2 family transporter protein [Chloroflexota bacterium]|nr:ABC-2 family transporter protein [Chloroflexota bacterium]